MKDNRGQTLVIFVILLPVLILLFAFIYEVSTMYIENNKLDNINISTIDYALDNINNDNIEDKITDLIKANDSDIDKINIDINVNSIKLELNKNKDSLFGNIIGIKNYKIVSKYTGTINDNKKIINKG